MRQLAIGLVSLTMVGCNGTPNYANVKSAPERSHRLQFETELVSAARSQCLVNVRLPGHRVAGGWLDERNSALKAATQTARACCADPKPALVEDWPVDFVAFNVAFECE